MEQKKSISAISSLVEAHAIVSKPILSEMCPLIFPNDNFWILIHSWCPLDALLVQTQTRYEMHIEFRLIGETQKRSHTENADAIWLTFPIAIDSESGLTMLSIKAFSNWQFQLILMRIRC